LIDPEAPYGDFTLTGDVPGLSLTADGTLQGTPTQAGTYTIEVEARDTWGNVINRTYTLHIDGALAPVEPTPTPIEPTPTPTPTEPTPTPTEPTPTPIDGSGSGNGSGAGNGSGTGNGSLANTGADQSGLWITAVGVVAAGIVLVTGAGLRRRSSR
ncbi:MAG: LPXTG cell wall anchor domain-containing protein, partial [Salana multivorans]|nr:LPXTG cell wall anchor domain-containing protein [Salana multivorans]